MINAKVKISSPQLNANTLINRLPPELLIRIFCINAYRGCYPDCCSLENVWTTDVLPPQLRDVITASQVCRRWRRVVVSAPELWCHLIDPTHSREEWKTLTLERSKPLGISYVPGRHELLSQGEISRGTEQNMRLIHYRLHITPGKDTPKWPTGANSWPLLEFLCVNYRESSDGNSNAPAESDRGNQTLPEDFPGTSTPNLKQLHLHHCIFQNATQLTHFSNTLTHFHVECPPPSAALSIHRWLDIIRILPRLRSLILKEAINLGQSNSSGKRNVELDLEEFGLEDTPRKCLQVLSQVTFARPCQFLSLKFLEFTYPDPDLDFILDYLSLILNSMSYSPSFTRCALALETLEYNCLGLKQTFQGDQRSPFSLPSHLRKDVLSGSVYIGFSHNPLQLPNSKAKSYIFDSLFRVFQPFLSDVEYLEPPRVLDPVRPKSMQRLLTQCRSLYRLELLTPPIWDIVYRSATPLGNRHDHLTFLPSLREIQFFVVDYPEDDGDYPHHEPLVRFCRHRKEIGCPVRTIYSPTYPFACSDENVAGDRAFNNLKAQLGVLGVQAVFRWVQEREG